LGGKYDLKKAVSWAFYDWANSAYATAVMAGFFPILFKEYWSAGIEVHVSTFRLGSANSVAAVIVAILAPVLGCLADRGSSKKKFLFFFLVMGVVSTGWLGFIDEGAWAVALACYVLATIGFMGGNVFYDSLIVNVAEETRMDFVSALGYSLGYLGGGLLFALTVWMTLSPQTFGLTGGAQSVKLSFVLVAGWWALFSIPLFLFVQEGGAQGETRDDKGAAFSGLRQFVASLREVRKTRVAFLFLIGYWLYIDGVDTIVLMAVDYGMSLGFDTGMLIKALLITQFVGFPAALCFGKIGEKLGTKRGIFIGLSVYILVAVCGFFMQRQEEFYILAVAIGLVQGGVQSLSRSFYAKLIPKEQAGEFFGFYNMLGKFAAVIGPFLMGWVSVTTGNSRYSILAVIVLFVSGAFVLYLVPEPTKTK